MQKNLKSPIVFWHLSKKWCCLDTWRKEVSMILEMASKFLHNIFCVPYLSWATLRVVLIHHAFSLDVRSCLATILRVYRLYPTTEHTSESQHNISLCIVGASFFNKRFTLFQPREHSISHLLFMRQLLVTWLEHEHWDMTVARERAHYAPCKEDSLQGWLTDVCAIVGGSFSSGNEMYATLWGRALTMFSLNF